MKNTRKIKMIVVLNAGSTSLKYKAFYLPTLKVAMEGQFTIDTKGKKREIEEKGIFEELLIRLDAVGEIKAFAHRVVHGGTEFSDPVIVDKEILTKLKETYDLAPLHNPHNISFIQLAMKSIPEAENIAIFDTGLYKDMPEEAKIYSIPYEYYESGVRKYGFHGISHEYVANEAAKKLKKPLSKCSLITIHLGGGASITAFKNGKAIDTSMGFTPLEGLTMISRSGDIDPGIIFYLMKKHKIRLEEMEEILIRNSGIKGISGLGDFREVLDGLQGEDIKPKLAFKIFVYKIKKYIGSYMGILGKVDAIVFTGGIGSGRPETREAVFKDMPILKGTKKFSIQTNEELLMAQKTINLLK